MPAAVKSSSRLLLLPAALALLPLAGCTTFDQIRPAWLGDGLPRGNVTQVAALWADGVTVQRYPNEKNFTVDTRCFSGRVYLFGLDARESYVAEGTLTIELFDVTKPDSLAENPRDIWQIREEHLQAVLSKDGLGWGYNLCLPWQTWSKDIERVSLVVVYQPKKGQAVGSGSTVVKVRSEDHEMVPAHLHRESMQKRGLPGTLNSATSATKSS